MLHLILFIEDDPITLLLCKKVINKTSFSEKIMTATNGKEALLYFDFLLQTNNQSTYPDLIFLDLNMPIIGGWEFLEIFCTEKYTVFRDIKIVILSSTIDPEDVKKSEKYPSIIAFLEKPISTQLLNELHEKLCKN